VELPPGRATVSPGASVANVRQAQGGRQMEVMTLEGVMYKGHMRLKTHIQRADNTTVYAVVPGAKLERTVHLTSPCVVYREQSADFVMEIVEASPNADL
jgi:hypothetical protein